MFKKIVFGKTRTVAPPDYVANMVAYWKMENNVLDSSGANDATATAITYAAGLVSQAAVFNGTTSRIHAQYATFDFFGAAKFSFVIPIKLNVLPSSGNIYHPMMIQNGTTTGTFDKGFRIFSDGSVGFYAFDGAAKTALSAAGVIAANTQYILTGIFNGTQLLMYVGNTLVGSVACSGSFNHANPRIVIGQVHSGSSVALDGLVDDTSVFNIDLTIDQIADINSKLNAGIPLI